MQYRTDKYGNKLSVLGYGCMRFSKTAGVIDLDKAEKEFGEIAKDLDVVGEGIGVTIRCQRAEIFEKMHRL